MSSTTTDPNLADNTATATTTVANAADLAITKSADFGVVRIGGQVTYTITTTNHGPTSALGVTVSDTLPAGTTFVSATPRQGSCT